MAALTTGQKIHVCNLARQAYDAWAGREDYERTATTGKNAFTAWRHDQQETAVGIRSLRHVTDADYRKLLSHFHRVRMVHLQDSAIEALPGFGRLSAPPDDRAEARTQDRHRAASRPQQCFI